MSSESSALNKIQPPSGELPSSKDVRKRPSAVVKISKPRKSGFEDDVEEAAPAKKPAMTIPQHVLFGGIQARQPVFEGRCPYKCPNMNKEEENGPNATRATGEKRQIHFADDKGEKLVHIKYFEIEEFYESEEYECVPYFDPIVKIKRFSKELQKEENGRKRFFAIEIDFAQDPHPNDLYCFTNSTKKPQNIPFEYPMNDKISASQTTGDTSMFGNTNCALIGTSNGHNMEMEKDEIHVVFASEIYSKYAKNHNKINKAKTGGPAFSNNGLTGDRGGSRSNPNFPATSSSLDFSSYYDLFFYKNDASKENHNDHSAKRGEGYQGSSRRRNHSENRNSDSAFKNFHRNKKNRRHRSSLPNRGSSSQREARYSNEHCDRRSLSPFQRGTHVNNQYRQNEHRRSSPPPPERDENFNSRYGQTSRRHQSSSSSRESSYQREASYDRHRRSPSPHECQRETHRRSPSPPRSSRRQPHSPERNSQFSPSGCDIN